MNTPLSTSSRGTGADADPDELREEGEEEDRQLGIEDVDARLAHAR